MDFISDQLPSLPIIFKFDLTTLSQLISHERDCGSVSRAGQKHPPKKKHANRPRPPIVVPLNDIQRSLKRGKNMIKL